MLPLSMTAPATLHAFCRGVLERGDLASKLAPPPEALADPTAAPVIFSGPARAPELALSSGLDKLPRPSSLADPRARARCLARFAHHELQAVELFAWALLCWPELPPALRRGLLCVLADEQRHCHLYLARLDALGHDLADFPRPGYFWRHAATLARAGPRAFLCAMGLTLEQANLDFAPLYRDGFAEAGDPQSAEVCEQVHRDEIRHVRLAAHWLRKLSPGRTDLEAYLESAPFPFAASRAKGRRFDASARHEAGLSPAFIEHVRAARGRK